MKKIILVFSLILYGLICGLLTGCSSCNRQLLYIETTPSVCGVKCVASNDKGSWCLPSTPGILAVTSSCQDLIIRTQKCGYQDNLVYVKARNLWGKTLVNYVRPSCCCTTYQYPDAIKIPMAPIGSD